MKENILQIVPNSRFGLQGSIRSQISENSAFRKKFCEFPGNYMCNLMVSETQQIIS